MVAQVHNKLCYREQILCIPYIEFVLVNVTVGGYGTLGAHVLMLYICIYTHTPHTHTHTNGVASHAFFLFLPASSSAAAGMGGMVAAAGESAGDCDPQVIL